MKLNKEQEARLVELAFAEKSNKEISQELGIALTDVHAARSRLGITIPKVREAKERESKQLGSPISRPSDAIRQEIAKVEKAKNEAVKKLERCVRRLVQLESELNLECREVK